MHDMLGLWELWCPLPWCCRELLTQHNTAHSTCQYLTSSWSNAIHEVYPMLNPGVLSVLAVLANIKQRRVVLSVVAGAVCPAVSPPVLYGQQ